MISFKPYKEGIDLLWALNELCNSQKHEIIIPFALDVGGGSSGNTYFEEVIYFACPPIWIARKRNENCPSSTR